MINAKADRFIMALLFCILFAGLGHTVPYMYYTYAPIETFYDFEIAVPEDVIIGDKFQSIHLYANVHVTKLGGVLRELKTFDVCATVYTQETKIILIEQNNSVPTILKFPLPEDLLPGIYYWDVFLTIQFPNGVERNVFWSTETFEAKY